MITQHTPGPWKITEIGGKRLYVEALSDNSETSLCAEIQTFEEEIIRDVDRGNAALIAAPPDLLEACRLIVKQFGGYPPATNDAPLNAARAAIRQSRGPVVRATLILRNGQRISVKGISQEYLDTLLGFKILAGYIIPSSAWSFFP